jgi:hypothetical protein
MNGGEWLNGGVIRKRRIAGVMARNDAAHVAHRVRSSYDGSMTATLRPEQGEALARQEDATAIRQGIADMEANRLVSIDEVDSRVHARLRTPLMERQSR